MGSFSDYVENKILDHIHGKTAFTMPTAYVGLKTGDPTDDNSGGTEPTIGTGGYARVATTGATWAAASGGVASNAVVITFPTSTAAWSTGATNLTHFIIMDAASGGNLLEHGTLDTPRAVNAADVILEFAIGDLNDSLT